nr:hypothetical protein BaRGS_002334 [Batillaria attramentaria]
MPYTYPKFAASHAPLPHIKKRVSPVDKSYVRPERHVQLPGKSWADVAPTHNAVGSGGNAADGLPASVAAALAAGNASEALYRMDLPPDLAAAYDKNLPSERAKAVVVGNRGRFPAPSFPSRVQTDKLLAIVSVERSNAVQVAA